MKSTWSAAAAASSLLLVAPPAALQCHTQKGQPVCLDFTKMESKILTSVNLHLSFQGGRSFGKQLGSVKELCSVEEGKKSPASKVSAKPNDGEWQIFGDLSALLHPYELTSLEADQLFCLLQLLEWTYTHTQRLPAVQILQKEWKSFKFNRNSTAEALQQYALLLPHLLRGEERCPCNVHAAASDCFANGAKKCKIQEKIVKLTTAFGQIARNHADSQISPFAYSQAKGALGKQRNSSLLRSLYTTCRGFPATSPLNEREKKLVDELEQNLRSVFL